MRRHHLNRRFLHNQICQRPFLHNQIPFRWTTPTASSGTWKRRVLMKIVVWWQTFAMAFANIQKDGWKITAVDRCGGPQSRRAPQNES